MARGIDVDGSGSSGHQQAQMGMGMPPGVPGVVPQLPPHQQPPPQTIQHHGPPPGSSFSMMQHPAQPPGQRKFIADFYSSESFLFNQLLCSSS